MTELLCDDMLVIASNNVKKNILNTLTKERKLINIKFLTLNEFVSKYFGTYDERAIYFMMKKYGLNYDVALKYLNNIFFNVPFLQNYYNDLFNNNLLIFEHEFKNHLNDILVIDYDDMDLYIKNELNKYNTRFISSYDGYKHYSPKVYEFNSMTTEISFVAADIVKKLEDNSIDDIYLVVGDDSYKFELKRIFDLYNLPINLDTRKTIYGTETCKMFIDVLSSSFDINKAIEVLPQNDIYNTIIDVLNKYSFVSNIDNTYVNVVINELKRKNVSNKALSGAVNVIGFDDIKENGIYYVLGFNQGVYPRLFHDDDLIKDNKKKLLGINTSLQKLRNEKSKVKNIISSIPNIIITYKKKDNYLTYYRSPLIDEMGLNIISNPDISYNFSHRYNKYALAMALDNLIKFNESTSDLNLLLNTYPDIGYGSYDNSFTGVNFEKVYNLLKGKINLSYTSINNYYLCAFKFYIKNILNLEPYEETFATLLGNLFHFVLSHMYDDNFDLKKCYEYFLKDKDLTEQEKHFVNKLYSELEFVINTVREQEQNSDFDKVMTEKRISIDIPSKLNIKFVGVVDKIKYMNDGDNILLSIIDYKSGNVETNLDNINHGLHLQLPVYIYLVSNGLNKKSMIVGFYLQKILQNRDVDSDDMAFKKKLRLEGYTINDEELIQKFDSSYQSSMTIKGMSTTKTGFSHFAKLVSEDDIDIINNIVSEKIEDVVKSVESCNFDINPKRIDGKIVGCDFCKFRDLCYRKEENIVDLKNTSFKDIIGKGE